MSKALWGQSLRAVPDLFPRGKIKMTGIEKEIVHQMRLEDNSHSQIASSLGISINTIKSYCRRNNLLVGGVDYVPAETTAHSL